MISIIARLLLVAISFLFAAYLVPGIVVLSFYTGLILAVFWGIVSLIVRPVLILLTLPINLITFGLFTLVINALLFWFLSSFIEGFKVDGFLAAFLGALIVSAGSWIGSKIFS